MFSSLLASVTNAEKMAVWARITTQVNVHSVAKREIREVKEKWRALKSAVLTKRELKKTGRGKCPEPVPFEEAILVQGDTKK